MTEAVQSRTYDLEERAFHFAERVRIFLKTIPYSIPNKEYCKQLARSSSAVGANYIEANQNLGRGDFIMRAKIAKKEAWESRYWLRLLDTEQNAALDAQRLLLIQEADELTKILGAIIANVLKKAPKT